MRFQSLNEWRYPTIGTYHCMSSSFRSWTKSNQSRDNIYLESNKFNASFNDSNDDNPKSDEGFEVSYLWISTCA